MERLTHEADFGFEEWEQTFYSVNSDQGGAYNILDIARHEGEGEFDEILKTISLRLKYYEDTGLTPLDIMELKERDTEKEPEEIQDAFGDGILICPNCRNSVINYFNRSRPPQFCMICGQRLKFGE